MSDNWRKPESVLLGMEHEMHNALTVRGAKATMSSREIAELTDKEHRNVMRDIRAMLDAINEDQLKFERMSPDAYGRQQPVFELDREMTELLLTGYSVELRRRVLARWRELEAEVARPTELSRMDILQIAMDAEREKLIAIEQRDEAIRTKSQISDRKTATAMATASAKAREVKRLQQELGRGQMHATVIAVEKALKRKFPANAYVALRKAAKAHGVQPTTVADPRWGTAKAWPAVAWREVHGIELADIFHLGTDQ